VLVVLWRQGDYECVRSGCLTVVYPMSGLPPMKYATGTLISERRYLRLSWKMAMLNIMMRFTLSPCQVPLHPTLSLRPTYLSS
jgi:hypothetical protein